MKSISGKCGQLDCSSFGLHLIQDEALGILGMSAILCHQILSFLENLELVEFLLDRLFLHNQNTYVLGRGSELLLEIVQNALRVGLTPIPDRFPLIAVQI